MQAVRLLLCLGLVGVSASRAEQKYGDHRSRRSAGVRGQSWLDSNCMWLARLKNQKLEVVSKLSRAAEAVRKDRSLSEMERDFQVHKIQVFQKELDESEGMVFQALRSLQRALQGDYKDVVNIKQNSRQRLESLRAAAIQEEEEYVQLVAAEKHQQEAVKSVLARNKSMSIVDEILEDVRKAADRLEEQIEEHAFDNNKQMHGVNVEAVLRVGEDEEDGRERNMSSQREEEEDLGLSMLIDSQNNQYVLTKPRDSTMPRADHHFMKDLVSVVMLSLPCGWLCNLVGLPPMFGYVISGVLLGPSGLNTIKSMVQVETLGELGVFFTLFVVGLEFSPERLRTVWKTSVQGSLYLCLLMVVCGLLGGQALCIRPAQTVFISTCLSLSSTPLVSRFLSGATKGDKEGALLNYLFPVPPQIGVPDTSDDEAPSTSPQVVKEDNDEESSMCTSSRQLESTLLTKGDLEYSSVLLGTLVMQDVQLGLFIALMPTMTKVQSGAADSLVFGCMRVLYLLAHILMSLAAVLLLCVLLKYFVVGPFYKKLHAQSKGKKEILVLGVSAFVFCMISVTEFLHVSMELGCFLAGMLLSSQGHLVTAEVLGCFEPIQDFLAIIFFASIGLHVFPTFVLYELTVLVALTLTLVILKFLMAVVVLSVILPPSSRHIRWVVSAGLAQVSEFSFVLSSRARRAGIISREVYLLVLSVTTLSLLLAPVLWRVTTHRWLSRAVL